jgi:hypothetical protein
MVKCCNEKLYGRTTSLIESFRWLLKLISSKQAGNLCVGKTKSYWTNNTTGFSILTAPFSRY